MYIEIFYIHNIFNGGKTNFNQLRSWVMMILDKQKLKFANYTIQIDE